MWTLLLDLSGIGEPSGHVSGPGGCGHCVTSSLGIGEPSGHVSGEFPFSSCADRLDMVGDDWGEQ